MRGLRWLPISVLVVALLVACSRQDSPSTPRPGASPGGSSSDPVTSTPTVAPPATPTPAAPTPTATPPVPDIWARHLRIPALGIDEVVQESEVVAVTGGGGDDGGGGGDGPVSMCMAAPATGPSPAPAPTEPAPTAPVGPSPVAEPSPSEPAGETTFTVPPEGVATPRDAFEFLRHRSWIFGHSRWLGVPGLFFDLDRLERGDELFVDGVDRLTGEPVTAARFVVTGIYLSDTGTGAELVYGNRIGSPTTPLVILQTSARESGENRPWILDRDMVLSKAENLLNGDVDNPCRYLLLFVVAEYAP